MIVTHKHGSNREPVVLRRPLTGGQSFTVHGDPVNKEATVWQGKTPAGFLTHDPIEEAIGTVYLSPQFRGKGLASRMYKAAGRPAHSTRLSEEGERFARRVGGQMPSTIRREQPMNVSEHEIMLHGEPGHPEASFSHWIREASTRQQRVTFFPRRR